MLLIISLLLMLTACSVNNKKSIATSDIPSITTTEMPKSTVSLTVTPTEMPITTGEPTLTPDNATNPENIKYGFENDIDAPYKQYIKSLKYLDENDLKSESYYMDFSVKMVETTSKSLSNWDKELNKIYSRLMNKLSTKDANNLRNEERMWIKERDKFVAELLPKSKKDGVSKDSEYLINNISVTAAEIDAFCESQKQKDKVIWYNLNTDNIQSQVANN